MKKGSLLILVLVATLFLSSLVSATLLEDMAVGASSFLKSIYLSTDNLTILLLGVLLWIVIFSVVSKMGLAGGKWNAGAAIISLIIVILSFIYLPKGFIETIVLQYGALGATILTVIPFAILLYFSISVSRSMFVARVIWVFYIMYYLSLFVYKLAVATTWSEAIPYIGAIIAGIVIFFALPTIRNLVWKGELEAKEEKAMRDIKFRELGRELERTETESRTR